MARQTGTKTVTENRKARHEFFVLETLEAGIELYGTEVKSVRAGSVSLKESWCEVRGGEIFVKQMNISPYERGNIFNRDPVRDRRLLLHKKEIARLFEQVKLQGLTLIPLSVYFKDSRVKIAVGLCKGKKLYDKREVAAQKDAQREMERATKQSQ